MAGLNGSNALVKVASNTTVARLANWSVSDSRGVVEIEPFGATKSEILGVGIRKITGSCSGWLDVADTAGQVALRTAYEAGTAISGVRFYVSAAKYYDAGDEFYITSFASTAAQGQAVTVSFNFSCSDWDLT